MTGACTIVIDGANVACQKHGTPSMSKLAAALAFFEALARQSGDRSVKCIAFAPNFWLNSKASAGEADTSVLQPADREVLRELVEHDRVVLTPSQAHDDYYVIDYAVKHDGFIVTNDMFRDHVANKRMFHGTRLSTSWVRTHCIDFTFVGNEFLPNPRAMERVHSYTPSPTLAVPTAAMGKTGPAAPTPAATASRSAPAPLRTSSLVATASERQDSDTADASSAVDDEDEMVVDGRVRLKRTIDLSEVTQYKVPRHLLPFLHGEGGETMARFQDYTGTYIVLPSLASSIQSHATPDVASLSIFGPESGRQLAVTTLDNFMREMAQRHAHEQLVLQHQQTQQMQMQMQMHHHHPVAYHAYHPEHHYSQPHAHVALASAAAPDDHMMDVDL